MSRMLYLTIDAASDEENEERLELEFDENNGHIPLDDEPAVNLVVGGSYFSMTVGIIKRFPDSYFARAIKDPWKLDGSKPLVFDRDGRLFKYVLEHMCGWKSTFGTRTVEWVLLLRREADFYNVGSLVNACDGQITRRLMDKCWHLSTEDLQIACTTSSCQQMSNVLSELFPSCFVSTVDTSALSEQFYESITSDVMDLPCLKPHSTRPELARLNQTEPVLEVSDHDSAALNAILKTLPSIPDNPMLSTGARIFRAVPPVKPCERSDRTGTAYCILKACENGGSISVTQNGSSFRISKAGECITFMHTYPSRAQQHYAHSGSGMVVLQCCLQRRELGCGRSRTALSLAERHIANDTLNALVRALNQELNNYTAVVMPLAKFYPIAAANMQHLSLQTDADVLNEQDAKLYQILCSYFRVTVVTVCYHCIDGVYSDCVLDHASDRVDQHSADESAASVTDTVLILPLEKGYGISARNRTDRTKTVLLVTALRISLK